jgi:protein TonB
MKMRTIVASVAVHGAVALFLISRAETNQKRRAITVAVPDKEKKPEKPKPPAPPKPIVHRPPPPKAEAPKPEPAPAPTKVAREAPAPVETKIALSNADLAPGGIALAGTPKLDKAATPTAKVASVVPEGERRRKHELGAGPPGEEACDEEPTKPEPVFKAEIEYTAEARANNVEGKLKLRVVVGVDGSVVDVVVENPVDPSLDAAAVEAVKRWRFKPALKCGKPVAGGVYRIQRTFELAD